MKQVYTFRACFWNMLYNTNERKTVVFANNMNGEQMQMK